MPEAFHHRVIASSPLMNYRRPMNETQYNEMLCNRFMLAWSASGMTKKAFGAEVGLMPSQMTNIKNYRNPPPRLAIERAVQRFGFTTEFFYSGLRVGMKDPTLPDRIRLAQKKLGLEG